MFTTQSDAIVSQSELIVFHGAREDILERLPSIEQGEQLEFAFNRISLIMEKQRVDVLIYAELPTDLSGKCSLMLLEVQFSHVDQHTAYAFVQGIQRGQPVLH